MKRILNKDLTTIIGGNINNLTRNNYQQSVYNKYTDPAIEPTPAPEYKDTFFLNEDKLDIRIDVNNQLQIGSRNSILDPKDVELQQYKDNLIILRKMSVVYLDMNYKRFSDTNENITENIRTLYGQNLAPSLLSKGYNFKNQSLPLVIKLYFNISNQKEYTDPNKFYDEIRDPKLQKKMINYYYKIIKKKITNIFIYFFNDINNSEYYLNSTKTPLKVHKLDDQDIRFRYAPFIRRMITNYLDIYYNIRGIYYDNTNLFTITVPLGNLNDYIQSSYEYTFKRTPIYDDKLRYILYYSHLISQGDPGVNRFIAFLNIILDKFIVVEKLKTQNNIKYKLIDLNPIRYPYINYHNNTTIHLFPTILVSYRSPNIQNTQIGSYNRLRWFTINDIPILLTDYDDYPQVKLETFYLSIHKNENVENNNNNENPPRALMNLERVRANTGRFVWRLPEPPAPAPANGQVPPPAPVV